MTYDECVIQKQFKESIKGATASLLLGAPTLPLINTCIKHPDLTFIQITNNYNHRSCAQCHTMSGVDQAEAS